MPVSEARKIAELEARTQLTSQIIGLLADPLWSTIAGFVAIHELRKSELIGPVADDVLYAGVIAINTARQPAMMELAGKGLSAAAAAAGAAAGVAGTAVAAKVGQKLIARGSSKLTFEKAMRLAAKTGGTYTTVIPTGLLTTNPAELRREGKLWHIWEYI